MTFLLIFLWLFLTGAPVEAAPLIALVVTAVGLTGTAAVIANVVIGIAVSFGISFLANKLFGPKDSGVAGGAQMDIRIDADVPQSLIIGRATTAGSLVTAETYGARGSIDNSDMIEIIAIADHPCEGFVGVFIESQIKDLQVDDGSRGQTVDGYNGNLALRFFDGTQVTADTYAVGALGSNPDRPWTSSHIGIGRAYIRTHSIYNSDLVPGRMQWRFVIDGIKLYDPRLDTSVGGSGTHRFDDLATHEWTANLAVIAYNVLRGIRVKDGLGNSIHFYGLENTPAANLPLDVWFAAMNEADVVIDGEPQFYGGGEVTVDTEPMEFLRSILASTGGKLVEIGGVYKLYLGAPSLSVYDFTDEDLLASKGDSFKPYLGLEQRINYMTGQYMSPEDGWISKVAPIRSMPAWEIEDGRRKQADLEAPLVQSAAHMQRIMQQMLFRSRQQRKHTVPLSRLAFHVEPGDIVSWTSERNGYTAKTFEVDGVEYESNLEVNISITEVDATDYDWNAAYDFLPEADTSITQARPSPKIITGFSAEAYIHYSDLGAKKPAIKLLWTPPVDGDVDGILYQLRRAAIPDDVINGSSDEPDAGALIILGGLASLTDYEIRARFRSFNGYASDWSLWIPVTTPDANITQAELDAGLDALIRRISDRLPDDLFTIRSDLDQLSASLNQHVAIIQERIGQINIGVGERYDQNKASAELALLAATDASSALAGMFVDLLAITPEALSEGRMRFVTAAAADGALASFAIELRATVDDVFESAGFYMDVGVFEGGATSRIRMVSDQIYFEDGQGLVLPALTFRAGGPAEDTPIVGSIIQADLRKQRLGYKTSLLSDATLTRPLGGESGYTYTHILRQDSVGGHNISFDLESFIGSTPVVDTAPLASTVLQCTLIDTGTGEWSAFVTGSGLPGVVLEYIGSYTMSLGGGSSGSTTIDIGDISADRLVVLSITCNQSYVNTVTLNGVGMTKRAFDNTSQLPNACISSLIVDTGTSASLVVNLAAAANAISVDVFTLKNYSSEVPVDTDWVTSAGSAVTTLSNIIDHRAGGVTIYSFALSDTVNDAVAWSSAFKHSNFANGGGSVVTSSASRKPSSDEFNHTETTTFASFKATMASATWL